MISNKHYLQTVLVVSWIKEWQIIQKSPAEAGLFHMWRRDRIIRASPSPFGPLPLVTFIHQLRWLMSNHEGSHQVISHTYKKALQKQGFFICGGETGIRTLDRLLTYAGFQDQCIQPLCHLSEDGESYLNYSKTWSPKYRFFLKILLLTQYNKCV